MPSASPWEQNNPGKGKMGDPRGSFLNLPDAALKIPGKETALKMGFPFVRKTSHWNCWFREEKILNKRMGKSLERLEKPSGVDH